MTIRRRRTIGALAALALLTAGVLVLWPRAGRVTRENFLRIEEGMSAAEIAAILGPADENTAPQADPQDKGKLFVAPRSFVSNDFVFVDWRTEPRPLDANASQSWSGPRGEISLNYSDGKAATKCWRQRAGFFQRAMYKLQEWLR